MGAPVPIVLSRKQREEYEKLCRSGKTSVRLRERLTIVLLAREGLNNGEISEHMSISAHKAGRWRNRFAEGGLAAIEKDLPRGGNYGGKNSQVQARLRQKVIEKTTQEVPVNATHWSTRTLAAELGTNYSFVARVWRDCGFKDLWSNVVFSDSNQAATWSLAGTSIPSLNFTPLTTFSRYL